jgi:hypothetical protein
MLQKIIIRLGHVLFFCAILACCHVQFGHRAFLGQGGLAWAATQGGSAPPEVPTTVDCQQLASLIQQQKIFISRETGQLKREIAALREDVSSPGIREIFAGVGYIFGLAGVGLYVHCRKNKNNEADTKS